MKRRHAALTIVGGGPSAMGLLAVAHDRGLLDVLKRQGLVVIDPARRPGPGRLCSYDIRSDTVGRTFIDAMAGIVEPDAVGVAARAALHRCRDDGPVALPILRPLLEAYGHVLLEPVGTSQVAEGVHLNGRATSATPTRHGVMITVRRGAEEIEIFTRTAVFATGGVPSVPPDVPESTRAPVIHSADVLSAVADLTGDRVRNVVIVGGSHSAFSAAGKILALPPGRGSATVTIAHRSPVRVTYDDVQQATQDGACFDASDVCPGTGRVFRFAGLRADSAALWRRHRDGDEPRLRCVALPDAQLRPHLRHASLVVCATGYRDAASSLVRAAPGTAVAPSAAIVVGPDGAMICDGVIEPRMRTIGLGTWRGRTPATGGEESFRGAIDGLWFYRHVAGPATLDAVLDHL